MTTLSYQPDPAHLAIKALLDPVTNFDLYDSGAVKDSDGNAKTIGAPLPYVVYAVTAPYAASLRAGGWGGRSWDFTLTYTHLTSLGAKSVMAAVREMLEGIELAIDGRMRNVRRVAPGDPVSVDFDREWTRPDGTALYFAVDRWRIT